MVRNNKGFSLIELIISIAILAVAGIAIVGFMSNTSVSYSQSNKEIKLQYEQQMAVNQIRDIVVEADKGVYFDSTSKTLALYGAVKTVGGSKTYPVTVINFAHAESKMYFGTKDFTTLADVSFANVTDRKLLSENVKDFNVDLTGVSKDKVQFEVKFMVGDKEMVVKETVALRNRLVVSNTVDTIWGDDAAVVDSFIKGIAIKRGTKVFSNGEVDAIGKCGESVVVEYNAVVTANESSSREYAVKWYLEDAIEGIGVSDKGEVTVAKSVPNNTMFNLCAVSVDDPTKDCYIKIVVEETGVYASEAQLSCSPAIVGNGYYSYTLLPTLIYTNNEQKKDYSLFTWNVSWDQSGKLPSGCSFDDETGVLILSSDANGHSFTISAKAKERTASGDAIVSNPITIKAEDIPKYVTGSTVSIAVASTVPRGGYVFPTMVFQNTTSSSYTYSWKVEPYFDGESTEWDTDNVANSSFNLISLSETGGYNASSVKHEMQTEVSKRSIALNCAEWLNWSKTFKVVIYGTAEDEKGNVLVASPKIITINPVEIEIERTDASTISKENWGWDSNKPVLTSSVLRYEDWYWDGTKKGSDLAKYCATRRWFTVRFNNLYMTATNTLGCWAEHKYLFRNQIGKELSNQNVGIPASRFDSSKMMCGFYKQLINWERLADRPVSMNYAITFKDSYGNEKTSNVENFTIQYQFYEPTEN